MIELLVAVGFAVFVSAACSLFEAVLYSVPTTHIEGMVHDGKPGSRIFKNLRDNVEGPVAAILTLNTIAHTVGASFAGAAATAVFGYQWLGYFTAFFTLAILIFSEIIPKRAGLAYGRRLAPLVAYPLKWLVWFMTPGIWLSNFFTRLIFRDKTEETITSEEIRVMSHLSLRKGVIKPYQDRAIENILTLQNKTVKDVMTPRTVIYSLSEHLTLKQATETTTKWEHSRFPVYDRDIEDVVGIVLTKEVFVSLAEGKGDTLLSEMTRPVHFVAETARLNTVLMDFLELREHLFAVIDEYGGLAGLISLEDVLEEILGREIVDESDEVVDKRELARQGRNMLVSKIHNP